MAGWVNFVILSPFVPFVSLVVKFLLQSVVIRVSPSRIGGGVWEELAAGMRLEVGKKRRPSSLKRWRANHPAIHPDVQGR
jgi:hypothetical protein